MTIFAPPGHGSSAIDTGDIPASLRFRRSASASISTGVTTTATSTYFCFFKQGALDAINPIFDGNIKINANNTITAFGLTTSAVKRDPTSQHWIHVSNNGLVFDGVNLGAVTTSAITNLRIGYDGTNYADMYGSRMCCVSGSSLPYTDFVYFNSTINEWVCKSQSAIKALVDAGGSAGFMYDFDNATSLTTLGYDKSSKGNNATLNNFSLTAGTTYDHMLDVPGNSFATLNPLDKLANPAGYITPTEGNLKGGSFGNNLSPFTVALPPTGKWFAQMHLATSSFPEYGLASFNGRGGGSATGVMAVYNGSYLAEGANGGTDGNYASASGDVGIVAVDVDANKCWLGRFRSGTTVWLGGGNPATGSSPTFSAGGGGGVYSTSFNAQVYRHVFVASGAGSDVWVAMPGQAPLHSSATYDSASGGYFCGTPPTGFKALCQRNLPDISPATLLDPTDHHVDITVTKSGDTSFTLPWDASVYDTFFEIKRRNASGDWYQIDGLRGYDKILKSNSTAAETTDANVLGVSGTTCTLKSTLADGIYIVSATKAGLSAARQTNTDGSITSTVSRNVDSGFSIVTYTGTGANATVGHGLGAAGKTRFIKARTGAATEWAAYYGDGTKYLYLSSTAGAGTNSAFWNNTNDTSTTFSLGTINHVNGNAVNYVAYCYADSAIQKSFSYTGNGSADGAHVDVGFKIGRARLKCSSTTGNWTVLDSARSDSNVADDVLYENLANAEATSALADITSRGIKFRIATDPNSAQTFIGHAWAATTGKYSLAR